jgi:hypothetical protein
MEDTVRHKLPSGMVMYSCNPSIWEAEAGRSRVQGQPVLHRETLSQNTTQRNKKKKTGSSSHGEAGHEQITPVIPATEEAETRRVMVQSQPRQVVHETLSQRYLTQKGLAEWLKFKAQHCKKKKNSMVTPEVPLRTCGGSREHTLPPKGGS